MPLCQPYAFRAINDATLLPSAGALSTSLALTPGSDTLYCGNFSTTAGDGAYIHVGASTTASASDYLVSSNTLHFINIPPTAPAISYIRKGAADIFFFATPGYSRRLTKITPLYDEAQTLSATASSQNATLTPGANILKVTNHTTGANTTMVFKVGAGSQTATIDDVPVPGGQTLYYVLNPDDTGFGYLRGVLQAVNSTFTITPCYGDFLNG